MSKTLPARETRPGAGFAMGLPPVAPFAFCQERAATLEAKVPTWPCVKAIDGSWTSEVLRDQREERIGIQARNRFTCTGLWFNQLLAADVAAASEAGNSIGLCLAATLLKRVVKPQMHAR